MSEKLSLLGRITAFQETMVDVEILKSKEAYGYFYADLPAIMAMITPVLKKHGIGYFHHTDYDLEARCNIVITTLFSTDDESDVRMSKTLIDGGVTLAKMNKFMVEGSAITYFRRYHLTTMLGLLTDEDSDAGGKKPTKQSPGRSVESTTKEPEAVDYVKIFTNLVKTKDKKGAEKTFAMYKSQLSVDQHKEITKIIQEAYDNK